MNQPAHDEEILLWPLGAPLATGTGVIDQPAISVHLAQGGSANGCAVLVCPGGGYRTLAADHEGLQVARWFNRLGITAFVLRYRLGEKYHSDVSLLDGKRAIRLIRSLAESLGISECRIGMLGFSAGGHLTAAVGTDYDNGDPAHDDPIERCSCRPDFLVLSYAVTNGPVRGRKADEYTPTDTRVTAATPPSFIMHTHEDSIVSAEQSLLFYSALLSVGVAAELHVFGYGEHGLGLCTGDPTLLEWTKLLHRWLRQSGFLTDCARTALTGQVTLDGKAMGMAWVTFIPADPTTPIARQKINRGMAGGIEIPEVSGPVPGPHHVEVHHLSERYPHEALSPYTLNDSCCYETDVIIREGEPVRLELESGSPTPGTRQP